MLSLRQKYWSILNEKPKISINLSRTKKQYRSGVVLTDWLPLSLSKKITLLPRQVIISSLRQVIISSLSQVLMISLRQVIIILQTRIITLSLRQVIIFLQTQIITLSLRKVIIFLQTQIIILSLRQGRLLSNPLGLLGHAACSAAGEGSQPAQVRDIFNETYVDKWMNQ